MNATIVADAVDHLVRGIVNNPDDVEVALVHGRRGRTIEIVVNLDDLGRVIGRRGRNATALRTVVSALGGRNLRVDVVDSDR